jgi:hypothetical protein
MSDFLDETRQDIQTRMGELQPAVDEYRWLEEAHAALERLTPGPAASTPRRGPGRPRKDGTSASSRPSPGHRAKRGTARKPAAAGVRRGRRKGSGGRAEQALALVTEQPGIQIPELAKLMGIKQSYLYRVLPSLERDGKVSKQGQRWNPTRTTAAA